MSQHVEGTIKDIAKTFGVNQAIANGFIRFLEQLDLAEKVGTAKREPGTRGKNSYVWKFPTELKLKPFEGEPETYDLPKD